MIDEPQKNGNGEENGDAPAEETPAEGATA